MTDYTPTTGEVRERYAGHNGSDWTRPEAPEFDRWLAAHDAEVKAEAWDEGYGDGSQDGSIVGVGRTANPYRTKEATK